MSQKSRDQPPSLLLQHVYKSWMESILTILTCSAMVHKLNSLNFMSRLYIGDIVGVLLEEGVKMELRYLNWRVVRV